MPSIGSKEQLFFLVALLLPGFIIACVRNVFVLRRDHSGYQEILAYILGSTISHAVGAPIWHLLLYAHLTAPQQWLSVVALLLAIPASIGLLWSYVLQNELIEKHAPWLGLFAVHHATTAWGWKLSRLRSTEWILVTLKDGTQHAGYVSGESFFASGSANRDLYIEQVYELSVDDEWKHPGRRKSVLIPYSEVKSIVFWPDEIEANHNGEKSSSELHKTGSAGPSDNGRV